MGFWSEGTGPETKRAYRWVAYFNNLDRWMVKAVTKPTFAISETSHRFINHTFWYPGRVEWNAIDLTLVDPMNPDATKTVMHMIEAAGYQVPDKVYEQWRTISKASAVAAVKRMKIQQIDAIGNVVEEWVLKSPWIKDVRFGSLSYDSEDIMDITMSIRYDWANLYTSNKSVLGAAPGVSESANFPTSYNRS